MRQRCITKQNCRDSANPCSHIVAKLCFAYCVCLLLCVSRIVRVVSRIVCVLRVVRVLSRIVCVSCIVRVLSRIVCVSRIIRVLSLAAVSRYVG